MTNSAERQQGWDRWFDDYAVTADFMTEREQPDGPKDKQTDRPVDDRQAPDERSSG